MAFQPSDLSGLISWYDAQDLASITQSGGAVSQWNDKSSSAVNVTQATSTKKPIYSATGFVAATGSRPGITFDGVDDFLSAAALPTTTIGPSSFFIAFRAASSATKIFLGLGLGDTGFGDEWTYGIQTNASGIGECYFEDFATAFGGNALFPATDAHYASFILTATTMQFRADGVNDLSGTVNSATISNVVTYVGGTNTPYRPFNGTLGEMILYDRALSGTEVSQVETYLKGKWIDTYVPPPIPSVTVAQRFQGAGQGLAEDKAYWDKVNNYWQAIEAARDRQRQKEAAQQKLEHEADQERQRIHARMAELRAIKARKKVDRERIATELALLQADEDQIKATLDAENQAIIAMIEEVNSLIIAMEAYKRRYQASLIMLLFGVN